MSDSDIIANNDQFICASCGKYSIGGMADECWDCVDGGTVVCELCGQDVDVATDDDYCYDCVDAAEELTGKEYAIYRTFFTSEGLYSQYDNMQGETIPAERALIDWPSKEAILQYRGIA